MKLMILSDYRGASEVLPAFAEGVRREAPDMVFYCGGSMRGEIRRREYENALKFHSKPDMDHPDVRKETTRDLEHLRQFVQALAEIPCSVYAVPGETDAPESEYLKVAYSYAHIYPNFRTAHERVYREEFFLVAWFGGGISQTDDERTLILHYTRPWAEFALRHLEYMPGEKVLLLHAPPVSRLDKGEGERHGSVFLNEVIERLAPRLVLHGQALKGQGTVKLGDSVVVNPGPLAAGHYALVDYPSLDVSFRNFRTFPAG